MDEAMSLSRNLNNRDLQNSAVILDFRELKVIKASMNSVTLPKDFERIVGYYRQHYAHTIDRLFQENGYVVEQKSPSPDTVQEPSQ